MRESQTIPIGAVMENDSEIQESLNSLLNDILEKDAKLNLKIQEVLTKDGEAVTRIYYDADTRRLNVELIEENEIRLSMKESKNAHREYNYHQSKMCELLVRQLNDRKMKESMDAGKTD